MSKQLSPEQTLEALLHHEIPLTHEMGFKVKICDLKQVELCAPLGININHKQTAFGGSLNTLAITASWCWLQNIMQCHELDAHIVIQSNQSEFILPVTQDFCAIAYAPEEEKLQRFLKVFQKKGRARIEIHAKIFQQQKIAVNFSGQFVAHQ
ncbi:MAG: thioesterase domain-containing protein [Gammaproteobacteria bacterium]|nr:thioesterase domain-containing protein [Gammaproteobacteria bacterium]MDH5729613.1 thioesterase domain-containing protein [Gammaproteobacteria bacterium]